MGHDGRSADGELGTRLPRSRSPKHLRARRSAAPNAAQETVILDAYRALFVTEPWMTMVNTQHHKQHE